MSRVEELKKEITAQLDFAGTQGYCEKLREQKPWLNEGIIERDNTRVMATVYIPALGKQCSPRVEFHLEDESRLEELLGLIRKDVAEVCGESAVLR